jgi:hypothetical protein
MERGDAERFYEPSGVKYMVCREGGIMENAGNREKHEVTRT